MACSFCLTYKKVILWTSQKIYAFLKQLHIQAYEQMLQGEMDKHLGYGKIIKET
jgi:hypothetical protein